MPCIVDIDQSSPENGLIEDHAFYKCIRPLILLQKVSGGWIHRPLKTCGGKLRNKAFFIYCLFWEVMTIGVILRSVFYFRESVSLQTTHMYIYLQISWYVAGGVSQTMSVFKYKKILPFWDNLLSRCPQEFSGTLRRPKIIIWMMVSLHMSAVAQFFVTLSYFTLKPEPEPLLLQLAQPWAYNQFARLIAMGTIVGIFSATICWSGGATHFLAAAYYLRSGFRRLHRTLVADQQLLNKLASYKTQHLHLTKLTVMLDDIFRGFIGASVVSSTFCICIAIFTLKDSSSAAAMTISINILTVFAVCIAIITVFSISIHSWVSFQSICKRLCGWCLQWLIS